LIHFYKRRIDYEYHNNRVSASEAESILKVSKCDNETKIMEKLTQNYSQLNDNLNDNRCVPNFNLLVNLKCKKRRIKRCWNVIFTHSFHLCLFITMVGAEVTQTTMVVNVGGNISLPCPYEEHNASSQLSWRHPGKLNMTDSFLLAESGALVLMDANHRDAGLYSCMLSDIIVAQVRLQVKDVPSRINKISVSTYSSYSIVSWEEPSNGGYPILGYVCRYRPDTSHLPSSQSSKTYSEKKLSSDSRTCDIYNLSPNSTYYLGVAAYNKLGSAEFNSQMTTTKHVDKVNHESLSSLPSAGYGRVLAMSIAVSVVALATLGSGIALLMIRQRGHAQPVRPLQESPGEDESLELVPHITLNPSFNIDMLEHIAPDFNENSEHAFLVGSPTGKER